MRIGIRLLFGLGLVLLSGTATARMGLVGRTRPFAISSEHRSAAVVGEMINVQKWSFGRWIGWQGWGLNGSSGGVQGTLLSYKVKALNRLF